MVLFEKAGVVGGQLNLARLVPGKEEFHGLVAWFSAALAGAGVDLRLGQAVGVDDLRGFGAVVVATGGAPRDPGIAGQGRALGYGAVLRRGRR